MGQKFQGDFFAGLLFLVLVSVSLFVYVLSQKNEYLKKEPDITVNYRIDCPDIRYYAETFDNNVFYKVYEVREISNGINSAKIIVGESAELKADCPVLKGNYGLKFPQN